MLQVLDAAHVPAGKIYTAADIASDPQYLSREMIVSSTDRHGQPLKVPGIMPKMSATPGAIRQPAPQLGEHTDEVMGQSGWPGASC